MASKKDFSQLNTRRVYETLEKATEEPAADQEKEQAAGQDRAQSQRKPYKPRRTYTEEEALESMMKMKTTGRKGVKMPRINLAFQPDVYSYIQTMAQVRGQSLTEFVNHVMRQSMEENAELYKKALEFRESL